jgi:hypothetical protein
MASKKTTTQNRSAITGRYVTPSYAKTHKTTTVTEHLVRTPSKSRGK